MVRCLARATLSASATDAPRSQVPAGCHRELRHYQTVDVIRVRLMRDAEGGWVGTEIADEFRGLGLVFVAAEPGGRAHARACRARLADLETYFSGIVAAGISSRPITAAYRVFFRQVGLDPEVDRTPVEQICFERLMRGHFVSRGLVPDALTIATLETEVPIRAVRARDVVGPLGITTSRDGEQLDGVPLAPASLVVADATRPLALLFGAIEAWAARDEPLVLYAPVVPGVSAAIAHEALWLTAQLLGGAD